MQRTYVISLFCPLFSVIRINLFVLQGNFSLLLFCTVASVQVYVIKAAVVGAGSGEH